ERPGFTPDSPSSFGPTPLTSGRGVSCTLSLIGSAPARDLFGVVGKSALRGDEFSAFATGVANRPAPGAFQIVGVCALGHAEIHEEGANGVGTDEQIALGKTLILIVLIWVHRETPASFRDNKQIF